MRATLLGEPAAVLRAALANTWEQLGRVALGDTLGNDWLENSITGSLREWFPAAEMARFRAGRQMQQTLRALAAPLNAPHAALLLLGAAATLVVAIRRRATLPGRFAALVLVAVLANAGVSGALSRPHDRYQARIAWLLLLPPLLMPRAARPAPAPPPPGPSAP